LINKITYYIFKIFSIFFSILPRNIAIFLGKGFGFFLYYFIPLRKKVAKFNLKIAFPKLTSIEKNKLILKTYKHFGVLLIEFFRKNKINLENQIKIDNETHRLLSLNKGIILMTAHLGNWEMIIPVLNKYRKTTIVVKVQRNSGGDRFVNEVRNLNNISLVPMGSSKKNMINNLKKGNILGLASDQNAGARGTRINFFGKELTIPKGAGYFYYKTKCPIVVGFCTLNKNNTYNFNLREIKINDLDIDVNNLFIKINTIFSKILEEEIKHNPEQYFWFHRKWDRNLYK